MEFHQKEEWLVRLVCSIHEVQGCRRRFVVNGFHPFAVQRAGVLDVSVGARFDDASRAEFLLEFWGLRIINIFRFFLRVQVVQVAQELVEAVVGRKHFVAVAQVILAELAGHVAVVLQQTRDGRILHLHALWSSRQADLRQADLRQARTDRRLSGNEGRATGGAALLAMPIGKYRAFPCNPVDTGRLVAHRALVVGTRIPVADVVAPDDDDVGLVRGISRDSGPSAEQCDDDQILHSSDLACNIKG